MISGSTHVVRKTGLADSAFNHKLYDVLDDDHSSDDSDNERSATKNQNFEFSDGYGVMRFIKLILFIQVIGLMLDHPSVQFSILFRIICRGVVFYSTQFYSRPFIDLLYLIQYFLVEIVNFIGQQKIPTTPSSENIEIITRRLTENPYASSINGTSPGTFQVTLDVIDEKTWHALKIYSHFSLGVLFYVMAVLFTIRFWEISDYSNRTEVKKWLAKYITDGWWRKGGAGVAISMLKGLAVMGGCLWLMFAISTQFSANSVPEGRIIGGTLAVGASVVVVIWALGYIGIRLTEAAFLRYVSQNVAYTSAIILKRAVKAKIDLGILLMAAIYMPLLYTLMQSLIVITDWNDTLAAVFRRDVNFFVPCYLMNFPPYRIQRLPTDTCPVAEHTAVSQQTEGFYLDSNILSCDSYWGICVYVVSAVLFVYLILGYAYMLHSMVSIVTTEFKASKWIDVLEKLMRIREEEVREYNDRFSAPSRFILATQLEIGIQADHVRKGVIWIFHTIVKVIKGTIRAAFRPLVVVLLPIKFLLDRLLALSCLNFLTAEGRNRAKQQETLRRKSTVVSAAKVVNKRSSWLRSSLTSLGRFGRRSVMRSSVFAGDLSGGSSGISTKFAFETDASFQDMTADADADPLAFENFTDRLLRIDVQKMITDRVTRVRYSMDKAWATSRPVVWTKVKIRMFMDRLYGARSKDGTNTATYASFGGQQATWRQELTLVSKTRLIRRLKQHILTELRLSKINFVAEHELLISFLDCTVDSAGLFTWVILYDYHRMYWFYVVFLELTVYAVLSGALNLNTTWVYKNVAFAVFNAAFGLLTYVANPYTEELDRWLEFCGRGLVITISIGTVICSIIRPDAVKTVPHGLYTPWLSSDYLSGADSRPFGIYEVIDVAMVTYFYCYIFYILYAIGFFGVVDRMVQSFQFGYHDHILDFLVEKLDERTIGMENVFSGLQLVQQWDDILKLQRRYALFSWPDVRPASLLSLSAKLFEIKWAALFNLTLNNLRSSLGLSILHTVMFSADGDVAKWIMHSNPDLLKVQDSQNDTPVTIALKECAYFLQAYGEQNDGALDDGTAYSDEQYAVYYPEVDDIRDDVFTNGEFQHDKCVVRMLNSRDLRMLKEDGRFIDTSAEEEEQKRQEDAAKAKNSKGRGGLLDAVKVDIHGNVKHNEEQLEAIKVEKKRRRTERACADKLQAEKQSIFSKRFPEDNIYENHESGQMLSWSTIGLVIPEECIFLDHSVMKRLVKDPAYRYNVLGALDLVGDEESLSVARHAPPVPLSFNKKKKSSRYQHHLTNANEADDEREEVAEEPVDIEIGATKLSIARPVDRDLDYVVRTERHVNIVEDGFVPMDHEELKGMLDFDRKRRKKRSMRRGSMNSSVNDSDGRSSTMNGSVRSGNSGTSNGSGSTMFDAIVKLNSVKADRETRWKICKFAEILMSEEIAKSCHDMKWRISDFKAFNKLASISQGKIAQNLALVCHLNPPAGFARLSDWSKPVVESMFDEMPDPDMHMFIRGVVAIIGAAERVTNIATTVVSSALVIPDLKMLRGRSKRRRTSRSLTIKGNQDDNDSTASVAKQTFSDRVIQYLTESFVCSTDCIDLDDAELSYNACVSWRAIARALRRKHCTFILPSLFVPPKQMLIKYLLLPRNELDCGDAVYIADIFTHQPTLQHVDLSFNRIGSRGMTRMCKALRENKTLVTFRIDYNIIGPACGLDVGLWLKSTSSLKVLSMSHNRMGEIVRFPTLYVRERIPSAAHDVFLGVRQNKSLESLDLSYNHLGPICADVVPIAVNKHLNLHTLNLSGNDLGPEKGPHLIFCLAGNPGGAKFAKEKEKFMESIKKRQAEKAKGDQDFANGVDSSAASLAPESSTVNMSSMLGGVGEESLASDGNNNSNNITADNSVVMAGGALESRGGGYGGGALGSPTKAGTKDKDVSMALSTFKETSDMISKPAALISLSLADNQIGEFGGHAIASLLERNKNITHLDISGNSLMHVGGMLVSDQLELCYSIKPRDFLKIVLWEIEERKFTGRNAKKRRKIYTHLTSLNLSRNGIGPNVMASLAMSLASPSCTLTDLDVSDNPLGFSVHKAGIATDSAVDIRYGLSAAKSLQSLNLSRTAFQPVEIVSIMGGLSSNEMLVRVELEGVRLDEPSCLQLCNVLSRCVSVVHINFKKCRMGANGGTLIANKIGELGERLKYVDLTENYVGQIAAIYLSEAIKNPKSSIHTLRLAGNDLGSEGGEHLAKSLIGNIRVTDLDLSSNYLTYENAVYVADAARGLFENGKKVNDSRFKRFLISDNPEIGTKGAKLLIKSLANEHIEHLEMVNVGARPGAANLISNAIRDPTVAWKYLDVGGNFFSRSGLNQIFWALRQNKRLRILKCGDNGSGTIFCSNADALLKHGISVPQTIRHNSVLRELDLSYNGLCTEAGINILDAMIDNHTIKKLSLRGNIIDDNVALMLPDLLRCNNVLEELDLGHNRLGFTCAYAIAESLEINRSLKVLILDYNRFGGAGSATLDIFCRSVMMNFSLKILVFDGNKLGPEWGMRLAEAFARNNTLTQVSLRDNRLDSRAGKALYNSFRFCPYMLEMALSADEIGQELWEKFRVLFDEKRACVSPDQYRQETVLTDRESKQLASYAMQ